MDRNLLLKETGIFAKNISSMLKSTTSSEFYIGIENSIERFNKYKFLDLVMFQASRKNINIPSSFEEFLTYDEDLQKDIMYSFLLHSKIKKPNRSKSV